MLSARVVRSLTMSLRDREYVTAAKYMGVRGPTIIVRHILPNISSLLIIDATARRSPPPSSPRPALSFFGFGIRSPETSLGTADRRGRPAWRRRSRGCSPAAPDSVVVLVLVGQLHR